MSGDQIGQADRFVTEFFSDQSISARSLVALIEKQVERLQDSVETCGELWSGGDFEGDARCANPLFRPCQSFGMAASLVRNALGNPATLNPQSVLKASAT